MFFLEQFLHLNLIDVLILIGVSVNLLVVFFLRKLIGSKIRGLKHRTLFRCLLIALCLPAAIAFYSFFIEPNWLTTKKYQVDTEHIELTEPIRIVVIGDLQAKTYLTPSYVSYVVKKVNQLDPSYVVWVGDLFQDGNVEDETTLMQLANISAQDGKVAVLGNHDYQVKLTQPFDSSISDKAEEILTASGFEVLRNETTTTKTNDLAITWAGTEDLWTDNIDFIKINKEVSENNNKVNILVTHQPLTVLKNDQSNLYALTLAGHCHGGQISLGIFNQFFGLPKVPPGCPEGTNQTKGLMNHNNHLILTTPGLGSLNMRARLLTPPEISVVELY